MSSRSLFVAIGLFLRGARALTPPILDAVSSGSECNVDGNADLYGIGIRLGFYMQTFGLFLKLYLKRKEEDHIDSNTIWFHIALLVALCYNSAHGSIYVGEVFVVTNILWILIWAEGYLVSLFAWTWVDDVSIMDVASTPSESSFDKLIKEPLLRKSLPLALALLLWSIMHFYLAWFWWHGITHLPRAPCGDKAFFFFKKVDMHKWFHLLGKIWHTMSAVISGLMWLVPVIMLALIPFVLREYSTST